MSHNTLYLSCDFVFIIVNLFLIITTFFHNCNFISHNWTILYIKLKISQFPVLFEFILLWGGKHASESNVEKYDLSTPLSDGTVAASWRPDRQQAEKKILDERALREVKSVARSDWKLLTPCDTK